MRISCIFPVILVITLLALAGCTMPATSEPPSSVSPGPTETLPPGQDVTLQIDQKDPIYDTIIVVFAGGDGQIAVSNIQVKVTLSDGRTETKQLPAVKGDEVRFQGTSGTDRVEAWVTLNTGKTYKTVDTLLPHRTRP